jgi:hypothetical protein
MTAGGERTPRESANAHFNRLGCRADLAENVSHSQAGIARRLRQYAFDQPECVV